MELKYDYPEHNDYTRPGFKIKEHKGVIVHWTGTPRATARNIVDAFNRNITNEVHASTHYVVGIDGEVIEYIPREEIGYHGGALDRKYYTKTANDLWSDQDEKFWYPYYYLLGIECCHEDISGSFTLETIQGLTDLLLDIWKEYDAGDMLTHIHRHTDITRKGRRDIEDELPCPRWFVEHPDDWLQLQLAVKGVYLENTRMGCIWPFKKKL